MCGRFMLAASPQALADLLELPPADLQAKPRFNIAPTQPVLICRAAESGGREAARARWGLIPSWAQDPAIGNRMINARAETAASKPAFRAAVRRRRCLVPADGFYEWAARERGRQPYLFRAPDGAPFALAGLWEVWAPPPEAQGALPGLEERSGPVESCTILTRPADEVVGAVHARMPVIVPPDRFADWLDPDSPGADLLASLAESRPPISLVAQAVSRRVNNPRHDDPSCIAPAS